MPEFSAGDAYTYFEKTYHDPQRNYSYTALPEMVRPDIPSHFFSIRSPSLRDLSKSAKRKRNGAAAGLNGLCYIPYKKCIVLLKFVEKIGRKIWKSKQIPADWAQAYIILLAKSEDLSQISEFRPIAITSIHSWEDFFFCYFGQTSSFYDPELLYHKRHPKRFSFWSPRLPRHTFTLMEALKEAKEHQRKIVISWLDLAYAYESVWHKFIQFALKWYHVPLIIQQLIFDCCENYVRW